MRVWSLRPPHLPETGVVMSLPPRRALDQTIRNRIFYTLYAAVFSTMIGVGIVIPLLPRYVATLGASGIWIGAIFSSFALSKALFLPVFGRLSDRHGRRQLILAGLCAYTGISALYLCATSVTEITLLRFFHGMASAMVLPVAIAYICDISPAGEEGRYIGSFTSSTCLGLSFGPLLGGVILDLASMNVVFLSMTLLSLLALGTTVVFLPDVPPRPAVRNPSCSLLLHAGLRGPVLYQLMYAFANGTFMVFIPVIAIQSGSLSATETGLVILVSILSTTVFQHFFSRISNRFGRYQLIATGSGLIASSLIIVPWLTGLLPFLFSSLLMGIGRGLSLPAMYGVVAGVGREVGHGRASGMVNTVLAIGLIIAPLVSGGVMDASGLAVVFFAAGIISLLCAPVFIRMGRNSDLS